MTITIFKTRKVYAGYYILLANGEEVGYIHKADDFDGWDILDVCDNFVCSGNTIKDAIKLFTL